MTLPIVLQNITDTYQQILGSRLTGIYEHGSAAWGCYNPRHSDIDLLVVTSVAPDQRQKQALIKQLLACRDQVPAKGLEMSVVLAEHLRPLTYPTPYCLHYSPRYDLRTRSDLAAYCIASHGLDRDLACHAAVTRCTGKVLCGAPVDQVFGPVSPEIFRDSIVHDLDGSLIAITEHPTDIILNLCRSLAWSDDGRLRSKLDGGRWALEKGPIIYIPLIQAALDDYMHDIPFEWPAAACINFAKWALDDLGINS